MVAPICQFRYTYTPAWLLKEEEARAGRAALAKATRWILGLETLLSGHFGPPKEVFFNPLIEIFQACKAPSRPQGFIASISSAVSHLGKKFLVYRHLPSPLGVNEKFKSYLFEF
jgi:hypothetical protein